MAARKYQVRKVPRISRAEQEALVALCIYTTACPKNASAGRAFESLVRRGYARRHKLPVYSPAARAVAKGKVVYCYKATESGMRTLRLVYARRRA